MLLPRFVAAICVLVCFGLPSLADTISESNSQTSEQLSQIEFLEPEETVSLDEDAETISVPEPAAFGLITLGLAIAGGLLVRNRTQAY